MLAPPPCQVVLMKYLDRSVSSLTTSRGRTTYTTLPAGQTIGMASASWGGVFPHLWLPGTTTVAPFSAVKSSNAVPVSTVRSRDGSSDPLTDQDRRT